MSTLGEGEELHVMGDQGGRYWFTLRMGKY